MVSDGSNQPRVFVLTPKSYCFFGQLLIAGIYLPVGSDSFEIYLASNRCSLLTVMIRVKVISYNLLQQNCVMCPDKCDEIAIHFGPPVDGCIYLS